MIRLGQCCCCIRLRTGAIIIAVFTLISAAYSIYNVISSFLITQADIDEMVKLLAKLDITRADIEREILVARVTGVIETIGLSITGVCLGLSITKNSSGFVVPWLVYRLIGIIFALIMGIFALTIKNWFFGFFYLINIPLGLYFWLCIYSFYLELKENPGMSRPM